MDFRLDILMWDNDPHRITYVMQKYPNRSLRVARNSVDLLEQLKRNPTLVIINTNQTFDEDHVYKLLAEGLTDGAVVVTFAQNLAYRRNVVRRLRALGATVVSFEMNNVYLWMSLYNVLNQNNIENYNDYHYLDCEVPEEHSGG